MNSNTYKKTKGTENRRRMMRKLVAAAAAVMLLCTGCGGAQAATGSTGSSASAENAAAVYDAAGKSEQFTERDLSGEYDESAALKIDLNGTSAEVSAEGTETKSADVSIDGSTVTIKSEGTYILSGTLTDGMIIVEADDSAKVQIVLDGAEITSQASAAIYVSQQTKSSSPRQKEQKTHSPTEALSQQ